ALVGRVPGVGEDGHVPGVDGGAGRREELRRRPLRAEDVRLEALVEVRDQLRERGRRAAELGAVVDVENRDPLPPGEDPPVDRLDPARVPARVEGPLRMRTGAAAEGAAA